MKRRSVRILLFTLAPLLLNVGVLSLLTYRQMRQDRLNQTLIAALKAEDYPAALQALQQGADARTRDFPPNTRSFWLMLLDQLHGNPAQVALDVPTALDLLILRPMESQKETSAPQSVSASSLPTLKDWETVLYALLKGGANPNDYDSINGQPLFGDLMLTYPVDVIKAFLDYGYRLDVHSEKADEWLDISLLNPNRGVTALLLVQGMNPPLLVEAAMYHNLEVVKALLDRGDSASTQATDRNNALAEAEQVRKVLIEDPQTYYIPILNGMPTIDWRVKNIDNVIALLKAHGATSRRGH